MRDAAADTLNCGYVNPFSLFSFRSSVEASKGFFAEATFCAFKRSTCAPQYGQILVFCSFVVNIKPWHFVHFTI